MTQIINSIADISERYDALFCDLWGCVHDGITPFDEALAAMQTFRQKGGSIILVTNSPRPHTDVQEQLLQIGISESFYDRIATSGDSARAAMYSGVVGRKVYFLGQPHDQSFFNPPDIYLNSPKITQVNIEQAEGIICCGPFNPLADLNEIKPQLSIAKAKGLKLLCANPDIVVDRGESREWCAGAVAKLYTEMGGKSIYFGKPHSPIYALARNLLDGLEKIVSNDRILCVGDGVLTDILGATAESFDSLFITGGLAASPTQTLKQPNPQALATFLKDNVADPTYSIGKLR